MTQKDYVPPNGENPARSRGEGGVLRDAKTAASHVMSEAKDELSSRASSQKDRAVRGLSTVAEALRGTKRELDDNAPGFGPLAEKAAESVDRLSDYVRTRTVGDIIDNVERFARRESAIFLGGAFALGLIAGRVLRSSPRGRGAYGGDYEHFTRPSGPADEDDLHDDEGHRRDHEGHAAVRSGHLRQVLRAEARVLRPHPGGHAHQGQRHEEDGHRVALSARDT